MKITLIAPMVKGEESFAVGKILDYSDEDAIALIDQGTAEPKNKKQYHEAKAKIAKALEVEEELKVKAYASLKQDELKESAEQLAKELQSTLELVEDAEFKSVLLLENFGIVSDVTEED